MENLTPEHVLDRLAAIVAATNDPWAERLHERLARIVTERGRLESLECAHLRVVREAAKLGRDRIDAEGPGADLWRQLAVDLGETLPPPEPKVERRRFRGIVPPLPEDGAQQADPRVTIAVLGLEVRTEALLRVAGYRNVGQLLHAGFEGLQRVKGIGRARCNEVAAALYEHGHNLPTHTAR